MRFGENALDGDRPRQGAAGRGAGSPCPRECAIVTTYDRSGLIRDSIYTLRRDADRRSDCRVAGGRSRSSSTSGPRSSRSSSLPVAVLASFVPMYYLGISSNIMSLGGLALAIGELVDAVHRDGGKRLPAYAGAPDGSLRQCPSRSAAAAIAARQQVGRPIFFSLAIIIVSFLPVFLLEAQEGRMFRPLAFMKTFAMASATLLSMTLVPVLMTFILRGRSCVRKRRTRFRRRAWRSTRRCLRLALRFRWTTLAVNFAVIPLAIPLIAVDRQRVHAAALRGIAALHADGAAGHVDHRGHAHAAAARPACSADSPRWSESSGPSAAARPPPTTRRWGW